MDYNHSYSSTYSDLYFIPTSFDSDITNPLFHNSNQPIYRIGLIQINICHSTNIMNKTETIITTLYRVKGDITLLSHMVNNLTNI